MTADYQHIRQLYLEKLTGMISERDKVHLQDLLQKDDNARNIWAMLEEEGRELEIDRFLDRLDPESELQELKEQLDDRPPLEIFRWGRWAAAAVLIVGLGIAYFLVTSRKDDIVPIASSQKESPAQNKHIQLVLADGHSIALSKGAPETVSAGGVQLNNSGKILRYEGKTDKTALNTLIVPATQDYEVVLSDKSKVTLNSKTKLRFPFYFSGDSREVYVEGEAYFEVAKDAARPFIVHTSLADIHVKGTHFNVNTYEKGNVKTALIEGSVQIVAGKMKPLDLQPSFQAAFDINKGFSTTAIDPADILSWREGICYFQNRELGDLAGLISRWFAVEVVFDREKLRRHPVSGLLEKEQIHAFLKDLKTTSGINYYFQGDTLHLK